MSEGADGFVVIVNISVKAGYEEQFKTAIRANAAQSLALEENCWVFDVARTDRGNEYFLYEVYSDKQSFDAHLVTAHFLDFDVQTRPWVEAKAVKTYWRQSI